MVRKKANVRATRHELKNYRKKDNTLLIVIVIILAVLLLLFIFSSLGITGGATTTLKYYSPDEEDPDAPLKLIRTDTKSPDEPVIISSLPTPEETIPPSIEEPVPTSTIEPSNIIIITKPIETLWGIITTNSVTFEINKDGILVTTTKPTKGCVISVDVQGNILGGLCDDEFGSTYKTFELDASASNIFFFNSGGDNALNVEIEGSELGQY